MTHFTVLVTGDNIEGQLAPYDEAGEWFRASDGDPYELLGVGKDATSQQVEDAFKEKTKGIDEEDDAWYPLHSAQNLLLDPEQRAEYDKNGPRPASRWDYWVIGGRFQPKLLLRNGKMVHEATKGLVDIHGLRHIAAREARAWWRRWQMAIAGTPRPEPWSTFYDRFEAERKKQVEGMEAGIITALYTLDDARRDYAAQPRVEATKGRDDLLGWMGSPSDIPETEEEYVRLRVARALSVVAYVHEGVWHENGKTGWFGATSGAEMSELEWAEAFAAWFDALPDDTPLTIVDCHV